MEKDPAPPEETPKDAKPKKKKPKDDDDDEDEERKEQKRRAAETKRRLTRVVPAKKKAGSGANWFGTCALTTVYGAFGFLLLGKKLGDRREAHGGALHAVREAPRQWRRCRTAREGRRCGQPRAIFVERAVGVEALKLERGEHVRVRQLAATDSCLMRALELLAAAMVAVWPAHAPGVAV